MRKKSRPSTAKRGARSPAGYVRRVRRTTQGEVGISASPQDDDHRSVWSGSSRSRPMNSRPISSSGAQSWTRSCSRPGNPRCPNRRGHRRELDRHEIGDRPTADLQRSGRRTAAHAAAHDHDEVGEAGHTDGARRGGPRPYPGRLRRPSARETTPRGAPSRLPSPSVMDLRCVVAAICPFVMPYRAAREATQAMSMAEARAGSAASSRRTVRQSSSGAGPGSSWQADYFLVRCCGAA